MKKILQAPTAKIRYNVVDSLIPDELRGGMILDIGCGEYPYFLERIKFEHKIGFDPSCEDYFYKEKASSLLIYKERAPGLLYNFNANCLDVITIISVIEHFNLINIPRIFNEIYRILKPGGRFIMTCLNPKVDWFLHLIGWDIGHQEYYDIAIIRGMLEYMGFDEIHNGKFEFGLNRWLYADKEKK